MRTLEGQKRVIIENISPQIDGGRHPIKRIVQEGVVVNADVFADGHDRVMVFLGYRKKSKHQGRWKMSSMEPLGNDRWEGSFIPEVEGSHEYVIEAWVDHFATWQEALKKKFDDRQEVKTELLIGIELIEKVIGNASKAVQKKLNEAIELFRLNRNEAKTVSYALSQTVSDLMYGLREVEMVSSSTPLPLKVERQLALFSAWYEFFPRSTSLEEGQHGTFKDCERILPRIAEMGFDILYLPPIHPIGESFRKGENNSPTAKEGDPGSPWAIGSKDGGHKAIHKDLGTFEDFLDLIAKAEELNLQVALDFAIQCSPDHPYVKEHPKWFKWRPDGTIQYAENPPKKYQDILPINFETDDWENLWKELKSIVDFWINKGVRVFRVDNPHTKPYKFWEWLIAEIHAKHPDIIFLSEAFTRPRVMEKLAKVGFSQSYTYFTWRNTKQELQDYLKQLTGTNLREYYRPNFWPNTPDILPVSLEDQEEPAFLIRLILAATLSSSYGIYGPLFELGVNKAYPDKEEYIDSEKYEVRQWDWNRNTKIKELITQLNSIRRGNPALQTSWDIKFHETDHSQLICYSKTDQNGDNKLLIVVSLDSVNTLEGWVKVPLDDFGLDFHNPFVMRDLISGIRYSWKEEWNYIKLDPREMPAHLFRLEEG